MKFTTPTFAVLFSISLTSFAHSRPGDLLPAASVIKRSADIATVEIDENDGKVYVVGTFDTANGIPVPGMVRLLTNGEVDPAFQSGIGLAPSPMFLPLFSLSLCPAILPLPGGGMLIGDPSPGDLGWAILDGNGEIQPNALPAVLPETAMLPQFIHDGKVVSILWENDGNQLVRKIKKFNLNSGSEDALFSFQSTDPNLLPEQLIPAEGGGMWLLERNVSSSSSFQLQKLSDEGSTDPSHTPRSINAASAELVETENGTFAVRTSTRSPFWPGPNTYNQVDFRTSNDDDFITRTLSGTSPFLIEPNRSVVMQDPSSGYRLEDPDYLRRTLWRQRIDGSADLSFTGSRATQILRRFDDGRILVDGTHRTLQDGSPDPTWTSPMLLDSGTVRQLLPGKNGSVYGTGNFTMIDGNVRPGLARWLQDGSLDLSFAPPPAEGNVLDVAVLTDNRLIVLRQLDGFSSLERLNDDGTWDDTFQPASAFPVTPQLTAIKKIEPLPNGELLASAVWLGGDIWQSGLMRIATDGTVVAIPVTQGRTGSEILTLPNGRFFLDGLLYSLAGQIDSSFNPPSNTISGVPLCAVGNSWIFKKSALNGVLLVNSNGSIDSGFSDAQFPTFSAFACSGPGRAIYSAGNPSQSVVRHYSDGRLDPTFNAPAIERRNESIPAGLPLLGTTYNGLPASINSALVHPMTGQLWIGGDFTRSGNELRSGIAVLDATVIGGYAAWSDAIFTNAADSGENDDPDADGVTNWLEYAAGTDPRVADTDASQPDFVSVEPLCLSAARNPIATEIVTILEISDDLVTWRVATGAEAVRKIENGRDAFALARPSGPRYWRIRYQSL